MQQALPQEKQKIVLKLASLPRELMGLGHGGGHGHDEVGGGCALLLGL